MVHSETMATITSMTGKKVQRKAREKRISNPLLRNLFPVPLRGVSQEIGQEILPNELEYIE